MQHTEEQKKRFQEEFKKRKKRQIIAIIPIVIIMLIVTFGTKFGSNNTKSIIQAYIQSPLAPIYLLIFLITVVFSAKNCRCPACDVYLGKRFANRKYCRVCGIKLQ